jgi:hypothetical protein
MSQLGWTVRAMAQPVGGASANAPYSRLWLILLVHRFHCLLSLALAASVRETGRMAQYPRMDPYNRARYEQGVDAKIVIMGNTGSSLHPLRFQINLSNSPPGVGKTSLLYRYVQNRFDPKSITSTTGAFFVTKKVFINGLKVRLQLWDTAGQERFRSMVCP